MIVLWTMWKLPACYIFHNITWTSILGASNNCSVFMVSLLRLLCQTKQTHKTSCKASKHNNRGFMERIRANYRRIWYLLDNATHHLLHLVRCLLQKINLSKSQRSDIHTHSTLWMTSCRKMKAECVVILLFYCSCLLVTQPFVAHLVCLSQSNNINTSPRETI